MRQGGSRMAKEQKYYWKDGIGVEYECRRISAVHGDYSRHSIEVEYDCRMAAQGGCEHVISAEED